MSRTLAALVALAVMPAAFAADPPVKGPAPKEPDDRKPAIPDVVEIPEYQEGKAAELLKDKNEQVRVFGILRVLQNPGKEKAAVPSLIDLTAGRQQSLTRVLAMNALGAIGADAAEAVPNLTEMLDEKDKLIRAEAAKALGNIGPKSKDALPKLTAALGDDEPEVRNQAARAIGGLKAEGKAAVPALAKLYKESKDPAVRAGAIYGLGGIGPDSAEVAVPLLTAALKDRSREVRGWAAASLGRMGPAGRSALPQLKALNSDADPDVRDAVRAAIKALSE